VDLTGQAFKSVSVRLLAGIAIANSKRLAALLRMVELWVFVFFFRGQRRVVTRGVWFGNRTQHGCFWRAASLSLATPPLYFSVSSLIKWSMAVIHRYEDFEL
jgi:hypothetical protein